VRWTDSYQASLAVPATGATTTIGKPFALPQPVDKLGLILTAAGLSSSTLDVYVQGSWNEGDTWFDSIDIAQIAGGAASASVFYGINELNGSGTAPTVGTGTPTSASPAIPAGISTPPPWAPLLRLVTVSGSGTNSGGVMVSVLFVIQRTAVSGPELFGGH
jgi:hypothetical protein